MAEFYGLCLQLWNVAAANVLLAAGLLRTNPAHLVVLLWVVGYAPGAFTLARFFASSTSARYARALGLLFGLLWPLTIPAAGLYTLLAALVAGVALVGRACRGRPRLGY